MSASSTTQCLTMPEVAAELRISRTSVYTLVRRKELKAIKVLGKLRIRRVDLERYQSIAGNPAYHRAAI